MLLEVFCGGAAVEKLLYLVLHQLDEVWGCTDSGVCGNPDGKIPC
jgi:hypothetical protein